MQVSNPKLGKQMKKNIVMQIRNPNVGMQKLLEKPAKSKICG